MNNIRAIRKRLKLSQGDIAKALGVTQGLISHWEQGLSIPPTWALMKLSVMLNTPIDALVESGIPKNKKFIPILGTVPAGIPIEAVEDILGYEEISEQMASQGDYFCLRIIGDSMLPKISEGDLVVVKKQSDAESGSICVVMIDDSETTIKRIRKDKTGIWLIPNNPSYEPKFYTLMEIVSLPVRIIGKVVELRAKL